MNLNKAASLSETLFPVKEYPANFAYNNEEKREKWGRVKENTGYKFIVREDTNEILSCMTDEYRLITNESIHKRINPILEKNGAKLRECSLYSDGKKTIWRYVFPQTKIPICKGDICNPEVGIVNSYDGSAELQTWSGAFRLVCSNGLIVGFKLSSSRNKHSIYNNNINNIEEDIINTIEKTKEILVDSLPLLKETNIKRSHIKKVIEMLPTYAMEPLTQYLIANNPKTYWDLLNALTYISTHHMGRQRGATLKLENEIYPAIMKLAQA